MSIKIVAKPKVKVDEAFLKEYLSIQEEIKTRNAKIATMKDRIKAIVDETGEVDEKGNKILLVGSCEARQEARTSVSLDQEVATTLLKKKKLYADCTDIIINDSKVELAYNAKKITDAEMATMVHKSTNYALKVKAV